MAETIMLSWLLMASFIAVGQPATNRAALTRIADVQRLSDLEVENSPTVQLEAIVTLSIPQRSYVWVEDHEAGIRLYLRHKNFPVQAGDRVAVSGTVIPGETGPMISPERVEVLSNGEIPKPLARTATELNALNDLNRRVEVEGRVLQIFEKPTRWQIELEANASRFWAELSRGTNDNPAPLLGDVVRLRGVCVRQLFNWGETVRPAVLLQNGNDIVVLQRNPTQPPRDPKSLPVLPIGSLTRESIGQNAEMIHVRGKVLDQRLGEHIVVQDDTGSLSVDSTQMLIVPPREQVDAWGVPVWDAGRVSLANANFSLANSDSSSDTNDSASKLGKKPASLPVLTKASDLMNLSAEQASWKYPVKLRGVVTIYFSDRRQFFVQDATSGFYVAGPWNRSDLKTGDLVEVTGRSDPGSFAPMVVPKEVVVLGTAALPEARRTTLFQMATGQYDSQWIEAFGVVRAISQEKNLLRLKLTDTDGTLFVYLPTETVPTNLVDSVVRLRGICTTHPNANRQISSLVVWCPSLDHLRIEDAGSINPLDLKPQPIASLGQFRPHNALQRRLKVEGTVTLSPGGKSFFIQDDSGGLEVQTGSLTNQLTPGDHVMVTGYPAMGTYGIILRESVYEVLGHRDVPAPEQVEAEHALNPTWHNKLVQIDARLRFRTRVNDREVLTLQVPGWVFEVDSLQPVPETRTLEAGSLLRLTGIYRVRVDETHQPNAFQMVVASGDKIEVLERPSWWGIKHSLAVVSVLALLMAATTGWVMLLRRKLHQQTAILQQSEMKFRSLVEKSLVGVYIIQNGRFVYVNPRKADIFGYTPEEMQALDSVDRIIHPEDVPLVRGHLRSRLSGEIKTAHYHFRGRRKDGSIVYVEVLGSVTEYNGKPAVLGTSLDITARKSVEAALAQASTLLETLLANSPDYIYFKDCNSRFVRASRSLAEMFHKGDPAALIGKTDFDFFLHEHAQSAFEDEQAIIRTGQAMIGKPEKEIHQDGRTTWAMTTKLPWHDETGKIIGTFGISRDVTENKEAELKLAHERQLFRALVENLPDAIYFKDRESRFVRMSQSKMLRAQQALIQKFKTEHPGEAVPDELTDSKRCAEFLIGKTDFDIYPEHRARGAYEEEQTILKTGVPLIGHMEKYVRPEDSRAVWYHTTKMPWHDENGKVVGTFGVTRDITELKEAEAVLDYERELFRTLLDHFPDSIYFKDLESRFVRLSRSKAASALELVRREHEIRKPDEALPAHLQSVDVFGEHLIGKTDFDTFPTERARNAFDDEQRIIQTGQPLLAKVERVQRVDGKMSWCISTKMPWRDKEGKIIGTFGVSKDITELKEAESQLEAAHQRLIETSRLAGMAEVATDVLHNVGNVLNSVNISCSLTIDRIKTSKMSSLSKVSALLEEHRGRLAEFFTNDSRGQQIPDYLRALAEHLQGDQTLLLKELEQLLKHIDHIKQIVAMQQSYAKVAGVKEVISANQLVEDALHINAAALVRHDVHVEREFETTPPLSTEKHKVLQILVNLIRNAKYAMDDAKPHRKLLRLRIRTEDDQVKIEVIDNGVGIPPENLTRIFGHGFTTRQNGHGFGLHSSAIAVKELGGSLEAHSDGSGNGAMFTLSLPLKPINQTEPQRYEPAAI
ncbi:MAG TPA: PAS domain S-box protein [Verrucomicrobiae bacterium]